QCKASCRVTEFVCERFLALSGYISSPLRTRLGVRNYERLARLGSILNIVLYQARVGGKRISVLFQKGKLEGRKQQRGTKVLEPSTSH
ncbi:hypothetical protein ACHAWX_004424, partial [Stephanocyclus meneghinianus]